MSCLDLLRKVNDAATLTQGKDIILLLGGTGSGKSTTIHFLGGSKLKHTKVNGLNHITPYEVKNMDLKKTISSPFARSETRYISPVTVNPGDVEGYTGNSFVFCDSPGFEDTSGAEVDIANGVGIIRAVKRCKSVKLVILLSSKGMGDKQKGVKDVARTLVGLIPGIKDHIRSVFYLFTKFSKEEKDTIRALLVDTEKQMNDDEKSDSSFVMLFGDLLRKTRKNIQVVDPINGDPVDILQDLEEVSPIEHPEEVFQFCMTEKSKSIVQEQIRRDQLSIMSATQRSDYLFAKYKLDQLKFVNEILGLEYVKQIYSDCVQSTSKHLSKEYEEGIENMDRCLTNQTILTNEDIYKYQTYIDHCKLAATLRESHLGKEVVHSVAFIQHLDRQINAMSIELQDKEINDLLVKSYLDKMKLVLNNFPDCDSERYKSICQILSEKIKSVVTAFESSVLSNKFDGSASSINKLHEALTVLHDHIDCADMTEKYDRMKEYFLSYLKESVDKFNHTFEQEKLSSSDIHSLNSCVCMLESAKNTLGLHHHISRADIVKIYEDLLSKILNYFQEIVKKINAELKNKNAFHTLEKFLEQLVSIRTIAVIELKISRFHDSTVEKIVGYLRDAKQDAEQLLRALFNREGKVNYDKLAKSLLIIKDAAWIEKYQSREYTDVMKDLTDQLNEHIKEIKISVIEITLDLDNYSKIDSVYKKVLEIREMKSLEKFLPDVGQHLIDVNSWFETEINQVCIIIKSLFSVEEWKKEEKKGLDVKAAEKALYYFDTCKRNRISFQNDFVSLANSLEVFVRYYSEFVQNEMENCFEIIKQFQNNNNNTKELSENAR